MGDPPLNHRQNAQAQAQARTNKQNARAISHHRPSSPIIHRTKAIMRLSIQRRIPPKSGYETRQFARSIAQSTVQYLLEQHAAHSLCNRPFDRLDCKFLPASCNVAAQRQEREEKDSFTVSLSCRRPREPGTSLHPRRNQRPSTINPNLIRLPSKRPFFFAAPYGEAGALDLARDKNSQSHLRLARPPPGLDAPCSNQGLLAIYLGVRTDVTFASTHLQQRMASSAAALPSCKSRQRI